MGHFTAPFKDQKIPTTPSVVEPSPSGETTSAEQSEMGEASKGTSTTVANQFLQPKRKPYIPKGMTLRQDRLNRCSNTSETF